MSDKNKKSLFYIKFDWMYDELNLSNLTCDVFALIFSFTRNSELTYYGTLRYLADRLHASEKSVSRALKSLVDAGYINRIDINYNDTGYIRPTYKVSESILKNHTHDLDISDEVTDNYSEQSTADNLSIIDSNNDLTIADNLYEYTDNLSDNNKNNNKYNILSNSNKLELSKILSHSEKCDSYESFDSEYNDYNTDMPDSYNQTKNENISGDDVCGTSHACRTSDCKIDVGSNQSDVDKINALKLFKLKDQSRKSSHKRETEFTKCAKLIHLNKTYSDQLKNLLYQYLKFRITRKGLTEDVWKHILDQLEEAISDAPTKDNDKLNYLREYVVNNSLCCGYNTFYKIADRTLTQLLLSYNARSRGLNTDLDGLPKQHHGPIDSSTLAVNSDGTPMIF